MYSGSQNNIGQVGKALYMHATLSKCSHPGKAEFVFLPMINLSASDENCIYSTLHFIVTQAKSYNVHTKLWSTLLVEGYVDNRNCWVVQSYQRHYFKTWWIPYPYGFSWMHRTNYGSGSGFKELLCLIYADHTIPHMLTGIFKGSERIIFYWFY